jgi:hypothetical protein
MAVALFGLIGEPRSAIVDDPTASTESPVLAGHSPVAVKQPLA